MWLYRLLRSNRKPFFSITPSLVLLFIMLQLAVWYVLLNSAYEEVIYQNTQKKRAVVGWEKTLAQAKKLATASFVTDDWVVHQVTAVKAGIPTQWMIEGAASLVTWQALLEQIEEQVALNLSSAIWQNQLNGIWFGRLSFDVLMPSKDRSAHHWLPSQWPTSHFVEREWQLISTLHIANERSALLQYKQEKHWVSEGDWLPQAAMTVDHVLFDQLSLIAQDGKKVVLGIMQTQTDAKAN